MNTQKKVQEIESLTLKKLKKDELIILINQLISLIKTENNKPIIEEKKDNPIVEKKKHKIMILDLETTGFPDRISFDKYYPYTETKYYNNSRIVQIAFGIYYEDGTISKSYNYIIRPNGYTINNENIHGISHQKAFNEGVEMNSILSILDQELDDCKLIVAHNLIFDINILAAELVRHGEVELAKKFYKKPNYCTMVKGKHITNIYSGRYLKSPRLSELYYKLFNENIQNEHNAAYDVENTAKCYFAMMNN